MAEAPPRRRKKAGKLHGYYLPQYEVAPLSDDEFNAACAQLMLQPTEAASRAGFKGLTLRKSLDSVLGQYVNELAFAAIGPREREVAEELTSIARRLNDTIEWLLSGGINQDTSAPGVHGFGFGSTAAETAWIELLKTPGKDNPSLVQDTGQALLRLATVASTKAAELEEDASKRGPKSKSASLGVLRALARVLLGADISIEVPSDAEAEEAERRSPFFRSAKWMLATARARAERLSIPVADEARRLEGLGPLAFVRTLRKARTGIERVPGSLK